MAETLIPVELFCSYAQKDKKWLEKLEAHLSMLQRQGFISLWHRRLIAPGTDWTKAIDQRLETASVILLLVSADFIASDYCYGIEMQRALVREVLGEARVIPILVRSVEGWQQAPFAHLSVLPSDAKPLTSWRNKDTALADIAAGIRRVIVEELPQLSASASRAALPKIWNIPYPRNPFFIGRDDELAQIRHSLQEGQATALSQPQAISGLGGIGKTQLALEYAYRYHQGYQAVLWARAENTEALISSYVAIASLLQLPERKAKDPDITVQAVKTWLQTHRDWLLIFDNANELALLSDFLPPSLGGHLLLTTRAAATGRLARRLAIETLLPEQGTLLLLRRAGLIAPDAELSHASDEEQEQARRLTLELGGLPLALDQAGAYLEETGMDLASYWHLYQQHRMSLLQRRGGQVNDHPAPVATTWALSFEQVEERNPAAADLLRLLAFLAPDAIPEEILTVGASLLGPVLAPVAANAFLLNQAIEALRAYSLVQRDPREKTLSIHRLVQVVLQDTLSEEEKRTWAERALLAANAAFPVIETGAPFKHRSVSSAERELLYQRALHAFVQKLGPHNVAFSLHTLANLYAEQGKYVEAEFLYQRALHIKEQQLGPDYPDLASLLIGLAKLYIVQGKYAQACELLYQRALRNLEQQLGPGHPQVASLLTDLANLCAAQEKYEEAVSLYQRALAIKEKMLGPEHPDVVLSLNGLALLYTDQGRYEEAKLLYQRALPIWEQQLVPVHPEAAIISNNLAFLYTDQGRYEEAEVLYQRALHIWEQQVQPGHFDMGFTLAKLSALYVGLERFEEAKQFDQRARAIYEEQEAKHLSVTYPLANLASLYRAQGEYALAEPLYLLALQIHEQTLGVHHPQTTETREHFIALLHTMGKHGEATRLEAIQYEQ